MPSAVTSFYHVLFFELLIHRLVHSSRTIQSAVFNRIGVSSLLSGDEVQSVLRNRVNFQVLTFFRLLCIHDGRWIKPKAEKVLTHKTEYNT